MVCLVCSVTLTLIMVLITVFKTSDSKRMTNKLLSLRGGDDIFDSEKRTDFVVGKDRELLHFSIDLKWLFEKLGDKATWMRLLDFSIQSILRLSHVYEAEHQYRLQAAKLYRQIQLMNPANCSIRVFQGSMTDAQHFSLLKDRFILLYCEEEVADVVPSMETILARKALASSRVGGLVNDQFIFMSAFHRHPYAKYASSLIESFRTKKPLKYPYFVVLAPKEPAIDRNPDQPLKYRRNLQLDVLGVFSDHFKHINSLTLEKFLTKMLVENRERMRFEYSLPTDEEVLSIEGSSQRSKESKLESKDIDNESIS